MVPKGIASVAAADGAKCLTKILITIHASGKLFTLAFPAPLNLHRWCVRYLLYSCKGQLVHELAPQIGCSISPLVTFQTQGCCMI